MMPTNAGVVVFVLVVRVKRPPTRLNVSANLPPSNWKIGKLLVGPWPIATYQEGRRARRH